MRTIATAVLISALALWGCGEGSSGGKSGGAKDAKAQGAATTTPAGTTKPADPKGAKAGAKPAANLDRTTAEGTLGLFVTHMQQGEFQDALMLTDPESSGYSQIEQAVNVLAEAAKKDAGGQNITLEALMRAFMSRGWLGVVYEPLTVQDERARFEVKLVDHDVQTMDLRKIDGDWYVVAPEWIIVKGDVSDMMPASGNKAPAPKPTPTSTPPASPSTSGGK